MTDAALTEQGLCHPPSPRRRERFPEAIPITPGSSPFHPSPGVPQADKIFPALPVLNLQRRTEKENCQCSPAKVSRKRGHGCSCFSPPRTNLTFDLICLQPEKKVERKKKKSMSLSVWSWNEMVEEMAPLSTQHLEGQVQLLPSAWLHPKTCAS